MPVALATRISRLAGVVMTLSLLAGCHPEPYEGSAVTGVPLEITAPVPLRLGPAYCATPTAGPYPVEITARHGAIAATAGVP
jgi:hypothetical protein